MKCKGLSYNCSTCRQFYKQQEDHREHPPDRYRDVLYLWGVHHAQGGLRKIHRYDDLTAWAGRRERWEAYVMGLNDALGDLESHNQ